MKKNDFLKIQKLIPAVKRRYCRHATFVSSDKLLSFLKGHFFLKDFSISYLFLFEVLVCLSHFVLRPVQCRNFLHILNPWGKVMEGSCLRLKKICSKMVSNRRDGKRLFFFTDFCQLFTLFKCIFAPPSKRSMSNFVRFFGKVMERSGLRL